MQKTIFISFTELLYGVIVGVAITSIKELAFTEEVVLLLFALLVVCDDYILYHQDVEAIRESPRNALILFWLDLFVVGAWYALYLSTSRSIAVFSIGLAFFYTATTCWNLFFLKSRSTSEKFRNSDLPLVATGLLLAALAYWYELPYWVYLVGFFTVFVYWHRPRYAELLASDQEPDSGTGINRRDASP